MSCLNTRILQGSLDQLTMCRDCYGEIHAVGPVAEDNYALESWERQVFGGVRVSPFDHVCLLFNAAVRANEAHIDNFIETALFK